MKGVLFDIAYQIYNYFHVAKQNLSRVGKNQEVQGRLQRFTFSKTNPPLSNQPN